MNFWILCLLCVVQGLTEFLPVSSSGHLLFFEQVFNIDGNLMFLNLFLHIATLVAVVTVYRKVILNLLKKPLQPLTYKLIISTVITIFVAVVYKLLDFEKFNFSIYGFCFLITATLLLITHFFQKKSVCCVSSKEISTKHAVLVGFVQGIAVMPGISRSGSTISTLLLCGNDEKKAAEFSFLMSIPIIVGGFVLELFEVLSNPQTTNLFASINMIEYLFAFVLTFIVAFIALKLTIKILKNNKFIYFSIYLYIVGSIVVLMNFV